MSRRGIQFWVLARWIFSERMHIYDGAPRQMRSVGSSPAPLSSGWGPPACLVHLGAHGCGRLSRTCTLEYSGGVAGGGGCDERHASGGTASRAGRALLIRVDGSARGSAPELGCCPRLPSCPHGLRGLLGPEPLFAWDGACRRLAWNSALSATLLPDCHGHPHGHRGGKSRLCRARRGLGARRPLSGGLSAAGLSRPRPSGGEAAAWVCPASPPGIVVYTVIYALHRSKNMRRSPSNPEQLTFECANTLARITEACLHERRTRSVLPCETPHRFVCWHRRHTRSLLERLPVCAGCTAHAARA